MASSYTWAEIHVTPKNPSARYTSALARRVAQDLVRRGWRLEKVMTDNASEFRASDFTGTVERRHGHHVFIRAGRPQTNDYASHCTSFFSSDITFAERLRHLCFVGAAAPGCS